jgi:hypothetical protein
MSQKDFKGTSMGWKQQLFAGIEQAKDYYFAIFEKWC